MDSDPQPWAWVAPTCDMCLQRIVGRLVVELFRDQAVMLHPGLCRALFGAAMRLNPGMLEPQ